MIGLKYRSLIFVIILLFLSCHSEMLSDTQRKESKTHCGENDQLQHENGMLSKKEVSMCIFLFFGLGMSLQSD